MHSMTLLPALAAIGARVAYAQSSCTASTITISDAAEATDIPCRTVNSIEISADLAGEISIDGPETVRGDFIVNNATGLNSLSSSSITTIEGKFQLFGLERLSSVNFPALTEIAEIEWTHLPRLAEARLGQSGITSVEKVRISDTFLQSLDNFNVASVDEMIINNNARLTSYSSQLGNVSTLLSMDSNGRGLNITLANLVWATEIIINDAASVELPSLEFVNKSLRLDSNSFESFIAPNLTSVDEGDVSFIDNEQLTNVSFPLLERIGGSLTLVNNTELVTVDGFPELAEIEGAVRLGGNFEEVEMPALDNVVGTFTILSTSEDLSDSCDTFNDLGGIQGEVECVPGDEEANEGNFDGSSSGSGGSGNSDDDDDSASTMVSTNLLALVAVAVAGAFAQL